MPRPQSPAAAPLVDDDAGFLRLEHFLPYRLSRITAEASENLRAVYKRLYGLTVPEWRVLAILCEFGELTATAIGAHSAMHKTKVSRAAASLEKRRWLKRRADEADRRREFLTLTPQGRQAYEAILPEVLGFDARINERLGEEGARVVADAMTRLEKALGLKLGPRR